MKKLTLLAVTVLGVAVMSSASFGLSISLYAPANVGITSFSWTFDGVNTIDLYEEWGAVGRGFLIIDGLTTFQDYYVNKHITNLTGVDWNRFSNELLDPAGDQNDIDYDQAIEPWVPARFSHSNENDGLSFAQGTIGRSSTAFSTLLEDELGTKDFVEFYDGLVSGLGGFDLEKFGLRDNQINEPFLLAQRPNESVLPEPGTLMLLGAGLFGLGLFLRKR